MSTDNMSAGNMPAGAGFSSLAFPALRDHASAGVEARARVSGHAAGYAAGIKAAAIELARRRAELEAEAERAAIEARIEHDEALQALAAVRRALDERTAPVIETAQDALASASVAIAEAVIGRELTAGADSALSALHRALDTDEADAIVTVRLNPADLAALDTETREAAGVPLTADASLSQGDAIAEFPNGYLDARIERALRRVRDALLKDAP